MTNPNKTEAARPTQAEVLQKQRQDRELRPAPIKILREETNLDRTGWASGPWDDEPDLIEWRDPATGLLCLMVRHEGYGAWCGYIAIPITHPWGDAKFTGTAVKVHGGMTLGPSPWHPDDPLKDSDDLRWVGFDCHHSGYKGTGDLLPYSGRGGTYRDRAYVTAEVTKLAAQAQTAGKS